MADNGDPIDIEWHELPPTPQRKAWWPPKWVVIVIGAILGMVVFKLFGWWAILAMVVLIVCLWPVG